MANCLFSYKLNILYYRGIMKLFVKYVSKERLIDAFLGLGFSAMPAALTEGGKYWLIFDSVGDEMSRLGLSVDFTFDEVIPVKAVSNNLGHPNDEVFKHFFGNNWKKLLHPTSYKKALKYDENSIA